MSVLVVDVGGSSVKIMHSEKEEMRRFRSGKRLTPQLLVTQVRAHTHDWRFDVVSIGLPVPVAKEMPAVEPANLGEGWKGFDFAEAFHQPVRVVNDAALQAVGSYHGGRMLFMGLGTGLGSTLIVEHVVIPLEIGRLNATSRLKYVHLVSKSGLKKHGLARWRREVYAMVELLSEVFLTDYIVVGGGNARRLGKLPQGMYRGDNRDALTGGIRLWETGPPVADAGRHVWKIG
jgi:polyphosphate glucokinase